jgi:plastocyanin
MRIHMLNPSRTRVARWAALSLVLMSCGGDAVTPPDDSTGLTRVVATIVDSPLEIGQGTQATVEGRDATGATVPLGARVVTWSSSNVNIATVTNGGAVAGVGVGSTILTVTVQDGSTPRSATASLVVTAIPDAPVVADVSMAPQLFIPSQTVIKLGGTVRFQFTPIDHNVIWSPRLPGSPADILVTVNALVSRTFPTVGVYPFDCTVHPGMSGRIIVSP